MGINESARQGTDLRLAGNTQNRPLSCPLVSIVSPVYNAEKFVGRMLSSVLSQSYQHIEMICVDDGSVDSTEEVIKSFVGLFEERNMRLVYAGQPHGGQTSAVNTGLKLANGEFLSWVDSDDFLADKSIEMKFFALMSNEDFGVATSNYYVVNECNLDRVLFRQGDFFGNLNYQSRQFYLALAGMSIIVSNCHMVRMSCFDEAFPDRELVACSEGQNYQLVLPLFYRFERLYVDAPLAYYVIRNNSHYHRERSSAEWLSRNSALCDMLELVLDSLGFSTSEIRKLVRMSCFKLGDV